MYFKFYFSGLTALIIVIAALFVFKNLLSLPSDLVRLYNLRQDKEHFNRYVAERDAFLIYWILSFMIVGFLVMGLQTPA